MRAWRLTIPLLGVLTLAGWLAAQEGKSTPEKSAAEKANSAPVRSSGKAKAKLAIAVTPEREAAVMTFIERNHAELGELLTHLKENQPAAYEQAVREIFRTTERLAQVKERDPQQYELEVVVWKSQSRVQLIVAKMKMAVTDTLKADLRLALAAQVDAKLALQHHERQKLSDRLTKLDSDIVRQTADREKIIDRQFQQYAQGRGGKAGAKAAANKANGKKTMPVKTTPEGK